MDHMVSDLVVYTQDPSVSTLKVPRVTFQPLHTITGQAVQGLTVSGTFTSARNCQLLYMPGAVITR